jgi:transketolase
VLHVSTIKPFDRESVLAFARRFDRLIVAENHKTTGGLATLVVETLYDAGVEKPMIKIGLADSFFECGSQEYLEGKYGVDLPRFVRAIMEGR